MCKNQWLEGGGAGLCRLDGVGAGSLPGSLTARGRIGIGVCEAHSLRPSGQMK